MNKIKKILTHLRRHILFYIVWPLAFNIFSLKPIDKKLILFAYSKNYTSLPDNMISLYNELKARGYNCLIMSSPQSSFKRILYNIKFQKYYATCKCVFITDNFDPVYAHKPRKGTKVVQLWHACGAFKKWGFSTLDLAWGGSRKDMLRYPMHNTYTDVFVSGEAVIPYYAEAFNCSPEIIKPLGTPRTDVFFDRQFVSSGKEKVFKLLPEIGKRKIILYAPTFRGDSPEKSYNDTAIDFQKFYDEFNANYVVLLKLHPFTAKNFALTDEEKEKFPNFIFDISSLCSIDTALCCADILIADYSSLIFEYALLEKPMIFFAYDLEKYNRDRSFYFKYEDFVPGKIVKTNKELISAIKENAFNIEEIKAFKEKYMSACDGNVTKRIADYITE